MFTMCVCNLCIPCAYTTFAVCMQCVCNVYAMSLTGPVPMAEALGGDAAVYVAEDNTASNVDPLHVATLQRLTVAEQTETISDISDNARWLCRPEVWNNCETRSISIMTDAFSRATT